MKKVCFILSALTTFLISCNEEKCCEHGLSSGILSKDWIYTNDSMKLKMQLPRDWNIIVGMGYTALSKDNDGFCSKDYVYSTKEIEESKKDPLLLIDNLFKITKSDPKADKLEGPVIGFQLVRSTSLYHTAKEDFERMIKDYDEVSFGPDRRLTNIADRINKIELPQGNIFYYFFYENDMTREAVAIGIIHKDCYNLKIKIGAKDYRTLHETLDDFGGYWLDY